MPSPSFPGSYGKQCLVQYCINSTTARDYTMTIHLIHKREPSQYSCCL